MKEKNLPKKMYGAISKFFRKMPRGRRITILSTIGVILVALCAGGWVLLGEEKDVSVTVDGETIHYTTYAHTVEDFLAAEYILIDDTASVSPALDTPLEEGMEITVSRGNGVDIIADGETYYISAFPITVGEALDKVGLILDGDDIVTPGYGTPLADGMVIEVNRIEIKTEEREMPLAYSVERRYDETLDKSQEMIVTQGVPGTETDTYLVTYKDGEIAGEELISSQRVDPVNQVILVGSKDAADATEETQQSLEAVASTADSQTSTAATTETGTGSQIPPDSSQYSQVLTVKATAYTHDGTRTKMGTECRVGAIAVDPSVIPLGTRLYVEGYGYCTAEDTGGKIKGNRIDIFLDTEAECVNWGVRTVTVYVLN